MFSRRADAELAEELRYHLERQREALAAEGLRAEEARRGALRRFGNPVLTAERCRDQRHLGWAEDMADDLRRAGRNLRRAPGFSLAAVVLLALGIGAVTALFGPLYSLVLSPLPFPHPGRLVRVTAPIFDIMRDDFPQRRALSPVFSAVAAYYGEETPVAASAQARPAQMEVEHVTPEFFSVLGVEPRLGHAFARALLGAPVAVVGNRFWRSRLGAATDLSGLSIAVGTQHLAVAGVMPPGFGFPADTQVWAMGSAQGAAGTAQIVGRLQPGISLAAATARLRAVATYTGLGMNFATGPPLQPLHDYLLGDRRPLLWMLWALSVLFLLLACAGVANLVLARGVRRGPEVALRLALGADRSRLVCQLLAESLLLSAVAAPVGFGLALLVARYLRSSALAVVFHAPFRAAPAALPLAGLVLLLAVAATVICGLAPAWAGASPSFGAKLQASTGGGPGQSRTGRRGSQLQQWLVAGQLALALVFLVVGGLLLRSLVAHLRMNPGFQPRYVALVRLEIPELPSLNAAFRDFERRVRANPSLTHKAWADSAIQRDTRAQAVRNQLLLRRLRARFTGLREVESLGMMARPPVGDGPLLPSTLMRNDPSADPNEPYYSGLLVFAGANSFHVLGMHLLAGRVFSAADVSLARGYSYAAQKTGGWPDGALVPVLVNERLATVFWGSRSAIGKRFYAFISRVRVIGVVGDVRISPAQVESTVYWPFGWEPWAGWWDFVFKLRPNSSVTAFRTDANLIVTALAPWAPPPKVTSLREVLEKKRASLAFALDLLACFAALGVIVAGLGVYASAAQMAAARRREIGIRIALGARPAEIRAMALWRSVRLALWALPAGAFAAWALARGLSHWMFQVGAADPVSYAAAAALLVVLALVAGLWPAHRAAHADPVAALRDDG